MTPILQYSAARNIISVIPKPVAHILQLFPQLAWNIVPDHVFSSHLCQFHDIAGSGDPSRIISSYDTPWWIGHTAIPNELWQWDRVFACCIRHYQHWLVRLIHNSLEWWLILSSLALRMMVSFFPSRWMKPRVQHCWHWSGWENASGHWLRSNKRASMKRWGRLKCTLPS